MSMDGKTPHLLPLSLSESQKKIRDDVPRVCRWALINAVVFACAYIDNHIHLLCTQSSSILPCVELTDAEAALWTRMMCCAASQATAAVLALLLPCRRRSARHALAYLALAVTVLLHCMYISAYRVLIAANRGYTVGRIFYYVMICFYVVYDLRCLALLLRGSFTKHYAAY